jgi:hypothetical protein
VNEYITAGGHENVSAAHESTLEVTTDDYLTAAGDCILGIEADRAPDSFDEAFVDACQDSDATIEATLQVASHTARIEGSGHPELSFSSDRSLVCRTSDYIDERTVMIRADKAAVDIDRELVGALAAGAELELELSVF